MLHIRLALGLLLACVPAAQAQTVVPPVLEHVLAKFPDAKLSDGRSALDRAAAKGEGAHAPAGLLLHAPMVLVGAKTLQPQDASELVSWMKAKGRAVRMAHAGPWSASLECALQVQELLDTKLTLVAAASRIDAIDKLQAGAVDVMCEAVPLVIEPVRRGDVLAFVLASDERLPALWDVITADQAGMPLFSATSWLGVYTATSVAGMSQALTDDITSQLADAGWSVFAPSYQTSDAHKQHLAAEIERRKGRLDDAGQPVAP